MVGGGWLNEVGGWLHFHAGLLTPTSQLESAFLTYLLEWLKWPFLFDLRSPLANVWPYLAAYDKHFFD